jgi:hypothetical protein
MMGGGGGYNNHHTSYGSINSVLQQTPACSGFENNGLQGTLISQIDLSRQKPLETILHLEKCGVIKAPCTMRPSESLKRTQYYQTKKLTQQIAYGNVNCAPPMYSGPPLSTVNGGGSRT